MAHDAVVKEKAKEMFVVNGFSMNTIETMLPEVSKKTLYNWKEKDNWEDERRSRIVATKTRRERLEALLDRLLDEVDVNMSPQLIFSIGKIAATLKSTSTFQFTEEKEKKEDSKEISEETWDKIDERLGLK